MKYLLVVAHPDDETLGCGGTILKHKENGDETFWLVLTAPTLDNPIGYTKEFITDRNLLVNQVAEKYSFTKHFVLSYPDIFLHRIDLFDLIKSIEEVINIVQPNIIYMMFNNDVHSDHRVAFDAMYSCTKSFRKPFIEKVYMFEALSETEFAPSIPANTFVPNVYVDITDYMDKKIEIMSMYDTELMNPPYPRSLSSIEALARYRGTRAGVMYAEAFMLLYEKR
jgi:LmbE family N-acetylglucosaminyl deacetylase